MNARRVTSCGLWSRPMDSIWPRHPSCDYGFISWGLPFFLSASPLFFFFLYSAFFCLCFLSMTAFLNGRSVSVSYDVSLATSTVSSPNFCQNASSLVSVNTPHGVFTCSLNFAVASGSPSDVVLGLDWSAFYREYLINEGVHVMQSVPSTYLRRYSSSPVHEPDLMHTSQLLPSPSCQRPQSCVPSSMNSALSASLSENHTIINNLNASCSGSFHGPNFDILKKLLLDNDSVIYSTAYGLYDLLESHGISCQGLTVHAAQQSLLHHLIGGLCACSSSRACRAVAGSLTVVELNYMICSELIDSASALSLVQSKAICHGLGFSFDVGSDEHHLQQVVDSLTAWREFSASSSSQSLHSSVEALSRLSKPRLLSLAAAHGLSLFGTRDDLRLAIVQHIFSANCFATASITRPPACLDMEDSVPYSNMEDEHKLRLLQQLSPHIRLTSLRRVFKANDIPFTMDMSLGQLKRSLKRFLASKTRGKSTPTFVSEQLSWPQLVPTSVKEKVQNMFLDATSSERLAHGTCASCAEDCLLSDCQRFPLSAIDVTLLRRPDYDFLFSNDFAPGEDNEMDSPRWLHPHTVPPNMPYSEGPLAHVLLDKAGVEDRTGCSDDISLRLCDDCSSSLLRGKTPALSIANRNLLGELPPELQDLTPIEESMIARCRAQCWIVQLKDEDSDTSVPNAQRGMRGHVIIYPQDPSVVAEILPPKIEDILAPICVLFVGSAPPSEEWLRTKAKPLAVRANKIRQALIWLKAHNYLYSHIVIDHDRINALPENGILPFHVEHVLPSHAQDSVTSRYDGSELEADISDRNRSVSNDDMIFHNVVIADVNGHASSNELRAAAVRHVKKGKGYVELPRGCQPANEFHNPQLFPKMYPTLFPYGIGGFEDSKRASPISLKRHVKHLLALADRRFQVHNSFMFTAFNILQRRAVLLHTSIRVKRARFNSVANSLASVSAEAIHIVAERVSRGDLKTANSDEERQVLRLMQEVRVVNSHVPGSSSARTAMRNEIRALTMSKGSPSFYLTVNPADVYNPIVKFLAGAEINIDQLLPEQVPNYWEQSLLVAKNPVVAAKFFNIYMKAFISTLLGVDPSCPTENGTSGVFGIVNGYYGCVEAQGRGTLHCHMLVWLKGSLNPDVLKKTALENEDFKARLVSFLEDSIASSVPDELVPDVDLPTSSNHPCSERMSTNANPHIRRKHLRILVERCQRHKHNDTCWKYWKGPPHPKECRFDLDPKKIQPTTTIDPETGEIDLRRLDGMVNNFNATIIECIRCNMDIKFIGSGASAKAIVYYITDYISKSQLKTHVAYAALELAIQKLGAFNPLDDEKTCRAKRMLQKCAHAMISHQELSAQQVASYLMDFEDHFTSHEYRRLYWTAFEAFINKQDPSPECYSTDAPSPASDDSSAQTAPEIPDNDTELEDVPTPIDDVEEASNEHASNDEQLDEISISIDENGEVTSQASQLNDYIAREDSLQPLSLWEFAARADKVKGRASGFDAESYEEFVDFDGTEHVQLSVAQRLDQALQSTSKKRPTYSFTAQHEQCTTHMLRIRQPASAFIPVPVGSIPRRDREPLYPRYCRLMLIMFKPWKAACDLREHNESWADAFHRFRETTSCQHKYMSIIHNMQLMHECKDHRDEHIASRKNRKPLFSIAPELTNEDRYSLDDDTLTENISEADILHHLQLVDASHSLAQQSMSNNATACVNYATIAGLFDVNIPQNIAQEQIEAATEELQPTESSPLEDEWKTAYQRRRNRWKMRTTESVNDTHSPMNSNTYVCSIQDGSAFRNAQTGNSETPLSRIVPGNVSTPTEDNINADDVSKTWTLNDEQDRAFKLITNHSLQQNTDEPLRMYIAGPAGTGKTRIINAVKDFFEKKQQARRFRLASYMGIAARNIAGMTLHAALSLGQNQRSNENSKTHRDLIAMWEGVDYLFIDEVSMISCQFLTRISDALSIAKGNSAPFGGINIIFAGDFAQLPPVKETRLYAKLKPTTPSSTPYAQKAALGRALWLSVDTVVILKTPQRQKGSSNEEFVNLLSRLREGKCTNRDFNLLNTRVIDSETYPPLSTTPWKHAPLIVYDNGTKDAINAHAAYAFARESGKCLHWYYANDKRRGVSITDENLTRHLLTYHSGKTNQRLGRIPLVIGMPVIVAQNFDVEGGIVNGSRGTLSRIRFRINESNERTLVSVIVNIPDSSDEAMPHLQSHDLPVLPDAVDIKFQHPYNHSTCNIRRHQVPVLPAFAMTCHRAQGQSMPRVIVDLQACTGTEAPYVMVSRATSLQGLLILRPFEKKKITCCQSEDARNETERLWKLSLQTIINTGNENSAQAARRRLHECTRHNSDSSPKDTTPRSNWLVRQSLVHEHTPSPVLSPSNVSYANGDEQSARKYIQNNVLSPADTMSSSYQLTRQPLVQEHTSSPDPSPSSSSNTDDSEHRLTRQPLEHTSSPDSSSSSPSNTDNSEHISVLHFQLHRLVHSQNVSSNNAPNSASSGTLSGHNEHTPNDARIRRQPLLYRPAVRGELVKLSSPFQTLLRSLLSWQHLPRTQKETKSSSLVSLNRHPFRHRLKLRNSSSTTQPFFPPYLFPTSTMNSSFDSKCFPERLSSGLYKRLSDQIINAKSSALANAEYKETFHRDTTDWLKNFNYVDAGGRRFMPLVFGEVVSSALGTKMSAKGTFFTGGNDPKFITDETKVKDVIVLGRPTCATKNLAIQFNNQIAALNEVFQDDEKRYAGCNEGWNPKEWVRSSGTEDRKADMLVLTMLPKYTTSNDKAPKDSTKPRLKRQALDDDSDDLPDAEAGGAPGAPSGDGGSLTAPPVAPPNVEPKVGDLYDPRLLPDYGGDLFHHKQSKLIQLDVQNIDEKIVFPWDMYDELRPGTLVIAKTSLHCFWIGQKDGSMKQFYQINAHSIKILGKSDLAMEIPSIPDAPRTTKRKATDPPSHEGDDEAIFSSFSPKKLRQDTTMDPGSSGIPNATSDRLKSAADPKGKTKVPSTTQEQRQLWDSLRRARGGIVGSLALRLFLHHQPTTWVPNDLNLVAPRNHLYHINRFLLLKGFIKHRKPNLYPSTIRAHYAYIRRPTNNTPGYRLITLSETSSSKSVVYSLGDAPSTALMGIVTPSTLLCLYTDLLARRICVNANSRTLPLAMILTLNQRKLISVRSMGDRRIGMQ
ncbi:hypothetical protein Hypma_012444 [Hypsizygus marmoreus]|uniref:ATP-dependent DNA helicase n=1 Tax=Hypsizygus marmoreus TaxID=39966 RepID=A0A369JJ64_HYPMA|nr:hypothetical protein Hypma_012444 [Hypsizygus marmoreus]